MELPDARTLSLGLGVGGHASCLEMCISGSRGTRAGANAPLASFHPGLGNDRLLGAWTTPLGQMFNHAQFENACRLGENAGVGFAVPARQSEIDEARCQWLCSALVRLAFVALAVAHRRHCE